MGCADEMCVRGRFCRGGQVQATVSRFNTSIARIAIVGGGASGTVLAASLLRWLGPETQIVLIEKSKEIGRGLAFSTWDPSHLLNVRAGNMSAFPDRPDHFYEWLQIHGPRFGLGCPTRYCFVPRSVYGEYIGSLLRDQTRPDRLSIVQEECTGIVPAAESVTLEMASGAQLTADVVVLATGNEVRPPILGLRGESPWHPGVLEKIDRDAPILIVGTGLTMVDAVLSLSRRGHRGTMIAVSRHGLLPLQHQHAPRRTLDYEDVPFGAPISQLTRWVRGLARQVAQQKADWRSVIDALRPHTRALWKAMSFDQRLRFLRHARPWWDVHRHRMAPNIADLIRNLVADGRLRVAAARIVDLHPDGDRTQVVLRHREDQRTETISVAAVLECTGLPDDPRYTTNPVIQSLLAGGLIRPGPLAIGLDLAEDGALIGADGEASARLYAVGPVTRGIFWESIALPDIRNQCAELAILLGQRFAKMEQGLGI